MALDTKAKLGRLNALNDLPITWSEHEQAYELFNMVTGEIWVSDDTWRLRLIREYEIDGYMAESVYPCIPYGITIGE